MFRTKVSSSIPCFLNDNICQSFTDVFAENERDELKAEELFPPTFPGPLGTLTKYYDEDDLMEAEYMAEYVQYFWDHQ